MKLIIFLITKKLKQTITKDILFDEKMKPQNLNLKNKLKDLKTFSCCMYLPLKRFDF